MSAIGLRSFPAYADHTGTVVKVGPAAKREKFCAEIKWDHLKSLQSLHDDFLELAEPPK